MATKLATKQDSNYSRGDGSKSPSNETSIKLTREIEKLFFKDDTRPENDEEFDVQIKIFKADLVQCAGRIIGAIPIMDNKAAIIGSDKVLNLFNEFNQSIEELFGDQNNVLYDCTLHYKPDRNTCLEGFTTKINNNPRNHGISIREFLFSEETVLDFTSKHGQIELRIFGKQTSPKIISNNSSYEYQEIHYGAPGTGKSTTLKERKRNDSNLIMFRTTFHPDYDYASFVGSYKPISENVERCFIDSNGNLKKAISTGNINATEKKIIYSFREQVFLKAYLEAWNNPDKNVALVIDELNRGNCAQIFGDIFQLLDREKGFSDYPITPNSDVTEFLEEQFKKRKINKPVGKRKEVLEELYEKEFPNIISDIWDGKLMTLPDNFYIWATMNTSDQSLFPIDSAFKRRWAWKYIPISKPTNVSDWIILFKNVSDPSLPDSYNWWDFLVKINTIIYDITESADKQLGYFFCIAENNIISAETFVNKVIFYLWNDVFKNEGFDDSSLFTYIPDPITNKSKTLRFSDFYNQDGTINEDVTVQFLENVFNKKTEG